MWSYDYLPKVTARLSLVAPKPDFAFGLKIADKTKESELAQRLFEVSEPTVSASCIPSEPFSIMFPFLVFESKSLRGDALTATREMTHGLIKALDVIAASGLEDHLFVIGVCQVGYAFSLHLAHCTSDPSRAHKPRKVSLGVL